MLTVTRKIALEADAQAVLDASYKLRTPLGVPTVILDPADYPHTDSVWHALFGDTIEQRIIKRLTHEFMQHYNMRKNDASSLVESSLRYRTLSTVISLIEGAVKNKDLAAHSVRFRNLSTDYETPNLNIIICPQIANVGDKVLKHGLGLRDEHIPDMPGCNAEWNFIKLWHEYGHGIAGYNEAMADNISAIAHRYIFEEPLALMAVADIRAVKAMLSHENDLFLRKYGWGPVETLDSATCMKAPATWNETVEKSLVPVKAETRITDVQYVGRSLMKVCKSAFTEHDLLMLSMMSDHMAIKGNVQNEEQLRIARRFALAAQRLTLGTPAYLATLPKLSL